MDHFVQVRFHRYKGFKQYAVSLTRFNVLVGPNNCGKSTIVGAFRILSEAMRKARARRPQKVAGPDGSTLGYVVDTASISEATENVFYDYDDSEPATIRFKLSNGNELLLFFPEAGTCYLICYPKGREIQDPTDFRRAYDTQIALVPILGPVDHNEVLREKEAARLALLSTRAARNFRNIWYHYSDDFDEFRELVNSTWPGMDIDPPQVDYSGSPTRLLMFCPEQRTPREMYWTGFGFQVWCQMLTYLIQGRESSIFLIDEPDIYLHSDLQRQLLGILRSLGPDILIATHSTEIISEAESDDLVLVNKKSRHAKRVRHPGELQRVFQVLGSNLNPILTQLAKTKRALFVEGKDFLVLSRFARKLGKPAVANRSDFAVVPAEGFNPRKIKDFTDGINTTLGSRIAPAAVFDRDYRSEGESRAIEKEMEQHCTFARIHSRKEIENFLLNPIPLKRAVESRLAEHKKRTGESIAFKEEMSKILDEITSAKRNMVMARYLECRKKFMKSQDPAIANETIIEGLVAEFDRAWDDLETRLRLVPGKEVLSELNTRLQEDYGVTITPTLIVESFNRAEVETEMIELIEEIEKFSQSRPS